MSPGKFIKAALPWLITIFALVIAFRDVDWKTLYSHIGSANLIPLLSGILLTALSYVLRARRWQSLFPGKKTIPYSDSLRVLILGFFMNNVLPARAGEFVRAHLGSQVTSESRTLVLATIASERLVDGLTISIMFVIFAFGLGDQVLAERLFYVALAFAAVTIGVFAVLIVREKIFHYVERLQTRMNTKASDYALHRIKVFIDGLRPLTNWEHIPAIILWSVIIWGNELLVYRCVSTSYAANLGLPECVLLLVAVNFSSLIPAAPGGIGVVEMVGSAVLISLGVPKELALVIVLTQHAIQYLVVGIPGSLLMLTWKSRLARLDVDVSTPALSSGKTPAP